LTSSPVAASISFEPKKATLPHINLGTIKDYPHPAQDAMPTKRTCSTQFCTALSARSPAKSLFPTSTQLTTSGTAPLPSNKFHSISEPHLQATPRGGPAGSLARLLLPPTSCPRKNLFLTRFFHYRLKNKTFSVYCSNYSYSSFFLKITKVQDLS
jgi:hypothetical protein